MVQLDLTVQVLNLSPDVTLAELTTFFSYCGTVEKIQFQKDQEQALSASVTFLQPYAFQTALLLNGARLAGQQICIISSQDRVIPVTYSDKRKNHGAHRLIPAAQAVASKGVQIIKKTKEEMEENCKNSENGRMVMDHAKRAINAAELAAEKYLSSGTMWLSATIDKASKRVSALGAGKKDNPNSRKQ